MSTFQVLKYSRCNSNVCEANRKLTEGNYVRLLGEAPRGTCRKFVLCSGLGPCASRAGELPSVACGNGCGFPKISHVISLSTFQVLKYSRCNSNVCEANRKLTEGNYVRLLGEAPRDTCRKFVLCSGPAPGPAPGASRAGELPSVACGNGCGFPKISHVISMSTFQVLKCGRCNCNVCEASRKLTKGNYVRLLGEAPRDTCRKFVLCSCPRPRPRAPRPRPRSLRRGRKCARGSASTRRL